jgi:hypothetical protein
MSQDDFILNPRKMHHGKRSGIDKMTDPQVRAGIL